MNNWKTPFRQKVLGKVAWGKWFISVTVTLKFLNLSYNLFTYINVAHNYSGTYF